MLYTLRVISLDIAVGFAVTENLKLLRRSLKMTRFWRYSINYMWLPV